MQSITENTKEKIKEELKNFLIKENIPFEEEEIKIAIKGEVFDIQISGIPSISILIRGGIYLDIIEFKKHYAIIKTDMNNGFNKDSININKGKSEFENPVITYFNGKLIIYF